MPLGRRVWGLGKALLIVGGLAGTFLLFFGIAMRVALRAREVRVPALDGRTVAEATRQLADAGLTIRIDGTPRTDPRVPAGRIMRQVPIGGASARQQRSVRVWISDGPRSLVVPALVGQTERTARLRLEEDGLALASVTELQSPAYGPDTVIAQSPAPASRAPQVSLLVNRGEQARAFVMPDVIGTDGSQAAEALRRLGFRVSIVGTQPYPGLPAGTVVRQHPDGGYQVGADESTSIEVSR